MANAFKCDRCGEFTAGVPTGVATLTRPPNPYDDDIDCGPVRWELCERCARATRALLCNVKGNVPDAVFLRAVIDIDTQRK